jgi:membrane-bound ClpP family serine protease
LIIICAGLLIFSVFLFKSGSRILWKKPLPGLPNMIGVEGTVVRRLSPEGFVKAGGELWEARAENGTINTGTDVIVVAQKRLKIIVRPRPPENED